MAYLRDRRRKEFAYKSLRVIDEFFIQFAKILSIVSIGLIIPIIIIFQYLMEGRKK